MSRRRFLELAAAGAAVATVLPYCTPSNAAAATLPGLDLGDDDVAQTYYRVLLKHTRWAETQWDETAGHYRLADFSFAVVLGNAVLLTRGDYDAEAAAIDIATLRAHTLATLSHFAASNRLVGGTEWGQKLFFDTTFQLYFQLAGRLLWEQLDATTRTNLDLIASRQADYTAALGSGDDPTSGGWTPNGLNGGWAGDTKLEEMGVYAQALAPGLAWAPDVAGFGAWRDAFGRWSRNETGLPAADLANPSVIDGVAVSANIAHNVYDTFIAENHGSFGPHYQCELWRTSARNGIQFITANQPMPEVLASQPNGERLWQTIMSVMSDAGEPLMPMVNDREHLYGRDVIPIAFLAQVIGDRSAAWAEAALAARLESYQAFPPENRITKISGEPKYEPEARAEVAISYLLHEWRAGTGRPVRPLGQDEVFQAASGVRDYGVGPGLVTHQAVQAWAGAVSKSGFVKFAWQPAHDDWLFVISGSNPMFLPSTAAAVRVRQVRTESARRDGFDATATVLGFDSGRAGFATLPGGSVVYATSGTASGEGRLQLHNLTMPGIAGLDGSRTYTAGEGSATVPSQDSKPTTTVPAGAARVDTLTFPSVSKRWVRMLGVKPDPAYGYSVFELEVRAGESGANLASGRLTTASSADTGRGAPFATDGDQATRWAVSRADRPRADSWLAVDLGAPTSFDRIALYWESAAGRAYHVQVSDDGATWNDVVSYPPVDLSSTHGWLHVDGRAGLVVRGSSNPITVSGDTITLSDGPASGSAGMLVEGYPGLDTDGTRAAAARPAPSSPDLLASLAEEHLSLFNLSTEAVTTTVSIPQGRVTVRLYPGSQVVTAAGTDFAATLEAASAAVLPPRFTLTGLDGATVPVGVCAEVIDACRVRISGPKCVLRLTAPSGRHQDVALGGRTRNVTLPGVAYPLTDLALDRVTFPTSPLPPGMTDPSATVDGDGRTAWTPGPDGRMVVDLGDQQALGALRLDWTGGRPPRCEIATSSDGLTYLPVASIPAGRRSAALSGDARYVAVSVPGWRLHGARLRTLTIDPA